MRILNVFSLCLLSLCCLSSCQPVDPEKRTQTENKQFPFIQEKDTEKQKPFLPERIQVKESAPIKPVPESEILRIQYKKIEDGLKDLKAQNDPEIAKVYEMIDELTMLSKITSTDLFMIEAQIEENKKEISKSADLKIQNELLSKFLSNVHKIKDE